MKQFFKFTLAAILGVFIAFFLTFIISLGIIGAAFSSSEKPVTAKANSVYKLVLEGEIVERSTNDPFSSIFSNSLGQSVGNIGLDDILENIKKAKEDENIVGIYLQPKAVRAGYSTIKEIRDALEDFKSSGKFIISYADIYSQKMYYLSTVADKIYINPQGIIEFQGLSFQTVFYKNLLNKIGVEMQIVKVGTFKSAVEPYIQTEMSDANKKQVTTFMNGIWDEVLSEISNARNISQEKLNEYADEVVTWQSADKYIDYNLVDSLVYADGMDTVLVKMTKSKAEEDYNILTHSDMNNVKNNKKIEKEKIAVIYAVGGIDMAGGTSGIVSENLIKTINEVKDEENVKAVVLRVNSPGGSAYGSEQISHALYQLKEKKPLIVSMGDYAASGGYYISAPADTILAQPNTLTGSIGIFGAFPNISGLQKKLGLSFSGVKTNKLSDGISINRPFTGEERDLMQNFVNRGYELFVKRCAEGRNMSVDAIKEIAEGRVWTGKDAKELGLVDMLGGLDEAIKIAATKANLEKYTVKDYPKKEDFLTQLLKNSEATLEAKVLKSKLGNENYMLLQKIESASQFNGIYTLMPYEINIK